MRGWWLLTRDILLVIVGLAVLAYEISQPERDPLALLAAFTLLGLPFGFRQDEKNNKQQQ
jgi:hypothetical protein